MTDPRDDLDLRNAFSVVREENRGGAPPFPGLWGRARRLGDLRSVPARRLRLAGGVAVLLLVACAGLLILPKLAPSHFENHTGVAEASITSWKAPTDFLLEVPGREVLTTLPSIGRASQLITSDDGSKRSTHVD